MHDALEVISKRERRSAVAFRCASKDIDSCAPKVIIKVRGDDPDRGCTSEEPNDGFVEVIWAGTGV